MVISLRDGGDDIFHFLSSLGKRNDSFLAAKPPPVIYKQLGRQNHSVNISEPFPATISLKYNVYVTCWVMGHNEKPYMNFINVSEVGGTLY